MTLTYTFRDGTTTMDTIEWAVKYEDDNYRNVKRSMHHDGKCFVSTIWQGIPEMGDGKPRTFETAVLDRGEIVWAEHSATEEEAIRKHDLYAGLLDQSPSLPDILKVLKRS